MTRLPARFPCSFGLPRHFVVARLIVASHDCEALAIANYLQQIIARSVLSRLAKPQRQA
jgi:hypothetical protein